MGGTDPQPLTEAFDGSFDSAGVVVATVCVDQAGNSNFGYQNFGYQLVGLVPERASGRDYPDLLGERLLVPLVSAADSAGRGDHGGTGTAGRDRSRS